GHAGACAVVGRLVAHRVRPRRGDCPGREFPRCGLDASSDEYTSRNHMTEHHEQLRLMLADDHPVVRAGLRAGLEAGADFAVVAEASSGEEAIKLAGVMAGWVVLKE